MKIKLSLFILAIIIISTCNIQSDNKDVKSKIDSSYLTAYDRMEIAFVGNPSRNEIMPKLERAMKFHGIEVNETNLSRCGSVLVSLRKSSKRGTTEMDILKQMNIDKVKETSFPDQAAISFTVLESFN